MDFSSNQKRSSAWNRTTSSASSSSALNNPITTLHHINFDGTPIETTVTYDPASITRWVTDILSLHGGKNKIIGLDIEWKPNRSKYMNNNAATLQLCIGTKCLIVQLIHLASIPQSLRDFMSRTSNVTFVGVELANDVSKLEREYGLYCRKIEDLREPAVIAGSMFSGNEIRPRAGLKDLAREIVGLIMEKPKYVTLSNWDVRNLSREQIEYACIDAYVSYRIGHKLLVECR